MNLPSPMPLAIPTPAAPIAGSAPEDVLLERARGGDEDAFRVLVERHGAEALRLAWRLTGSRDRAEDVAQEALLKAYRALPRFDGRSRFSTWLHRIVANCALDHLRRRPDAADAAVSSSPAASTRPSGAGDDGAGQPAEQTLERAPSAEPGPLRRALSSEIGQQVAGSLANLTPLERTAFVLRHFEGRSISEIGDALGTRANATKQAIFRAVQKLRRELAPLRDTMPEDATEEGYHAS